MRGCERGGFTGRVEDGLRKRGQEKGMVWREAILWAAERMRDEA